MERTLLLVDDEPQISQSLSRLLRQDDYRILTADSGPSGLKLLEDNEVQVIISDQRMPQMTGSEFLTITKEHYPQTVRIVLSGYADFSAVTEAINQGAIYKFLCKPWDDELIRAHVLEAFKRSELEWKNEQLTKIFDSTIEGIMITDQDHVIQSVNPAFETITGYARHEVMGKTPECLYSDRHDTEFYAVIHEALKTTGQWYGEIWRCRKDGTVYPEWVSNTALYDLKGNISQYVYLFIDITEQKKNEARIEYLAFHDELTGLPNRLLLNDRLTIALAQAKRNQWRAAVVFIDLDRFKNVNDRLGHDVGDRLLQGVTQRLKALTRVDDTLARLGGDEFILLLPKLDQNSGIHRVVHKILASFKAPFLVDDHELHVTPSIGVSVYPEDGENGELLMKNSDIAMYHAKDQGRNAYQFYASSMNTPVVENLALESDLHKALKQQEFVLYYQPQADAKTGKIIGMEALIRWQHPKLGFVSPDRFIPLAEETGLIHDIGAWVLRTACEQNYRWQEQFGRHFRVAVNLSSRQFQQADLVEMILEALIYSRLNSTSLEIEVTEGLLLQDTSHNITNLRRLNDHGIQLSLDDFGTGYSSLSYLRLFPFETLKIDQSFVQEITQVHRSASIVRAIIAMAHNLKLKVVAEGVETPEQLAFLRSQQCDMVQGYLIGKPLPADDFYRLLKVNQTKRTIS